MPQLISIIIPTFNEAAHIQELIYYIQKNSSSLINEILVSDGGSTDDTLQLAEQTGARVFVSPKKGRAAQMNYAAGLASGEILYFIHADTLPPASFATDITAAVNQGYILGRYRTQFNSKKWILKVNAFFTRFDWFICYGGDQTLFVTRQSFEALGGFKEMTIMEEYEFTARARKHGPYKIFNKASLVSARKYDNRSWWQVQMANRKAVAMYKNGASSDEIAAVYKNMLMIKQA